MFLLTVLACTTTEVPLPTTDEATPVPTGEVIPTPTEEPTTTGEPLPEERTVPPELVEGFALSGGAVTPFQGAQTERVGLRGDLVYAAVVNQTGAPWHRFQAGLVLVENGIVTYDDFTNCYAEQGGPTVVAGATAHCLWENPDYALADEAEVGFIDGAIPDDPAGAVELSGTPTVSGQGTRFGVVEAQFCQVPGAGSDVSVPAAITLDPQGRPWDTNIGPTFSTYSATCVPVRVGGLDMPESPTVVIYPR